MAKSVLKMNKARAEELLVPLHKGTAEGISQHWQARLIEALEYVIEHETPPNNACTGLAPTAAQESEGSTGASQ